MAKTLSLIFITAHRTHAAITPSAHSVFFRYQFVQNVIGFGSHAELESIQDN